MALALSPLGHRKRITECCYYKRQRHRNETHSWYSELLYAGSCVIVLLHVLLLLFTFLLFTFFIIFYFLLFYGLMPEIKTDWIGLNSLQNVIMSQIFLYFEN